MKYIAYKSEPLQFSSWKQLANNDWQPTYDNLSGEVKKAVKNALMEEQGYICCYCEQRLIYNNSHIEHFKPQSDPAVDPLDYNNILCSCQNQIQKGAPRHCGNLKEDWFDSTLLISPLEAGCDRRFCFKDDGTIRAADPDDVAAIATIDKLGLDLPLLNDLRNKAIEPFLDENLTAEDLEKFVYGYLQQNDGGMFGEFWTTIEQLFGSIFREDSSIVS
jgi:uncharacterized protein (TIGR02646 family)